MIDVSHLVTFVAGTAVGAAGSYMADRFTDQRRKKELRREANAAFGRVAAAAPKLIAEMREDIAKPETQNIREFVALPNERVIFNSDRPRLAYYESVHRDLANQVALLVDAGYVENVSTTKTPIYRMTEEFIRRLNGAA